MARRQREAMPRHDPIPPKLDRAALAWARYKRLMSWLAIAAVVAVLLSLVHLKGAGRPVPGPMRTAALEGVGLTGLLGTGLMGLDLRWEKRRGGKGGGGR